MTDKAKTLVLSKGTKVRLGDGRTGVVVRKEERVGFQGYIVKIVESLDKTQIGQTVGATVPAMKIISQVQKPVQTVVQPIQPVMPKDPLQEEEQKKRLKQEEVRLISQQIQNLNDRIKMLQTTAQATPLKQQDQFENLERIEEDEQEQLQQEQLEGTQQQMLQQTQQQFQQLMTQQQQQQMQKQSWVRPEHADIEILIKDTPILCDVAATPKQQASGLQAYDELPKDRGLWFPMYSRRTASFHMGNVLFPIDIIFIDNNKINKIISNVQPRQSGCWSSDCTDVIEVSGEWCKEHKAAVGDEVITPLANKKRIRAEIERVINKIAIASYSYDPVRAITEAENKDSLEEEVLRLFPHLKKAQELYKPSTDRKPTVDNRSPQIRFKDKDTPDISAPEGQDNPSLTLGDDVFPDSVTKNFKLQVGYDPVVFHDKELPHAIRPSAQRVEINSPGSATELAGVIPEKLAKGSVQLYIQYKPQWNDLEGDSREYQKIAIINDELVSKWVDSLGFDDKNEAILRKTVFTNAYKEMLGRALVTAGEASDFELLDSDLLLYR